MPSWPRATPRPGADVRRGRRRRRGGRARRRADEGLDRARRSAPRSSATSAASPGSSTSRRSRATSARCSRRPPTASAPRSPSPSAMDMHDTIGIDLVAMVVDDLVVCGAEPLFMTDYIATGKVVPERIAAIVSGIAEGCRQAGCALVGGETAEHPGLLAPDEYDVAGAGTGVVEADELLGPDRVRVGDVVDRDARRAACTPTATPSRGTCCSTTGGLGLDAHVDELGRTARRGAARADPDLLPRLPRPRARRRRRARDQPRHRRRPRRQPRPRAAGRRRRRRRPLDLGAAAGLRRWSASSAASRAPSWSGRSTWASA